MYEQTLNGPCIRLDPPLRYICTHALWSAFSYLRIVEAVDLTATHIIY